MERPDAAQVALDYVYRHRELVSKVRLVRLVWLEQKT